MASYEGMQAGGGWQQPMPSLETDYGNDEISEWLDIGPTVEEEAGWGVDEDEYTTGLDYSAFTPEQIRQAQMIAKQISHEQKQYGESRHFDRNMRDRRKQQQVKHDAAVGVHSAEDAIELLRRQKSDRPRLRVHSQVPMAMASKCIWHRYNMQTQIITRQRQWSGSGWSWISVQITSSCMGTRHPSMLHGSFCGSGKNFFSSFLIHHQMLKHRCCLGLHRSAGMFASAIL